MNLDIQTTVRTIFFMLLLGGAALVVVAFRAFKEAGRLNFFLKKRELLGRAWKFIFFAFLVLISAFLINNFAEPITYRIYQPSPSPTLSPTITMTPTITLTPTITITPSMTITPEFTPTPIMPAVLSEGFTSSVTPNPETSFSQLVFARSFTKDFFPIEPEDTFENPIVAIYGTFSYDRMALGSQWTALWFRDGELVCQDSEPWTYGSGGFGYTDCLLPAEKWLPGNYEVQIFVGETWKQSSNFSVVGDPPEPTPTFTVVATDTPPATSTPSATVTLFPTGTPTLTQTIAPMTATTASTIPPTRTFTQNPSSTVTLAPTLSLAPTLTPVPTTTRRSTISR